MSTSVMVFRFGAVSLDTHELHSDTHELVQYFPQLHLSRCGTVGPYDIFNITNILSTLILQFVCSCERVPAEAFVCACFRARVHRHICL